MKPLLVLFLAVSLAGCADLAVLTPEGQVDSNAWNTRQQDLYKLLRWSLKGKLAVQSGNEGWSAILHWDQDAQNYTMRFIAPLGQGTYELSGGPGAVTLLTADNHLYKSAGPEDLLQDNLGWNVPLHGLQYWVRGVPEPGVATDYLLLDEEGRMTDLQQSGWRISILNYRKVEGMQLPAKLFMQNDRFQLRLVVHDWKAAT